MKSTILIASAAILAAAAPPIRGQEPTAPASLFEFGRPASIRSREVIREAVRIAAAERSSAPPNREDVQQGMSEQSDWSRVRRVTPGNALGIAVLRNGAPGNVDPIVRRYFVSADDCHITLLNLSDPALPAAAARALREIASQHRGFLERAATGGRFIVGGLRLTSGGAFIADQRVAELRDVIEITARSAVVEIRIRERGRGVWGHLGPLGGYFAGALSGGYAAGVACQAVAGRDRCDSGAALTGIGVGGIAGLGYGLYAARRETENTVYRAETMNGERLIGNCVPQ